MTANQNTFIWVAIFALTAMVINSLGILLIYKNKAWAERSKEYFMCFASGVLIASPLTGAFPQAIAKNPNAGLAALAGFVFMFLSNRFIKHKTKQPELAFGIIALEGIGIHSFIDGIIYAVTFSVSIMTGVLAGIGLIVHEFAEGIITFAFLVKGGLSDKKAITYAFLVAALTTPVGAFVAYPFVSRLNSTILGLALGFVVGVMIYVSASHLLPQARENEREHAYIAFFMGVGLALFILFTKG
ncbi:ZIP family metal transporter [Acidaminobacter hydrogenoformans]|uniref:Zinc transporter, ZIP family n=1 Tax=Acidaminobacter hydrogenoformans DSM 2784 TaxID=1120920 RepID=A0A1G5S382_9FIRM|nr:ZIP family metal transporter [Acidaminobacter hydrogenoformans]SCZ80300.1 zinc transporter, ZIP family [Acidaminobacter hydrogenoformans DSM 2784]